ncbi:MAG: hypothetical protein M0R50_05870 [Candidatus Cloacimonetes bacterium]|jgi:hypothetical protein|nr:hypothetical protein [Candidatus Cloacimonadota bacterium]
MSKVRQLSEVFLRGSLANVTMKNLTKEERARIDELMVTVGEHEVLAGHRQEFIYQLGSTIAADYRDSSNAAQEEFQIAVWRGLVHLLYHTDYSFECSLCHSTSFLSQSNRVTQFNRCFGFCPVCNCCLISTPGDSTFKENDPLTQSEYLFVVDRLQRERKIPPTTKSCILAVHGAAKVDDPERILNDPEQLKKFFGSFIWNYFRQILLENPITKHQKRIVGLYGPADKTAADAINLLLSDLRAFHVYSGYPEHDKLYPNQSYYTITCDPMLLAPSDFYPRFWEIKEHLAALGGEIIVTPSNIMVRDMQGQSSYTEYSASVNSEVQIVNNVVSRRDDDGDSMDVISQLEDQHMLEDGTNAIEVREIIAHVQRCLPDGTCQAVFQLLSGTGPIYQEFVERFPDTPRINQGIPHKNRMAKFLGCTPKDIKQHEQTIGLQLIAHGVAVESVY